MADRDPDLHRRPEHDGGSLDAVDLGGDPVAALRSWLAVAEDAAIRDFNAMALATVDSSGHPTARNVLLRGIDDTGRLEFFTNRRSRKGSDIAGQSAVAVLFSWLSLDRQIRVDGTAEPTSDERSDAYFAQRPRDSRIAAWASEQSSVIADRAALDAAVAAVTSRFEGTEVPRPPHWGGYEITPRSFEFWQSRPGRLHDRIRFRRGTAADPWVVERLAP